MNDDEKLILDLWIDRLKIELGQIRAAILLNLLLSGILLVNLFMEDYSYDRELVRLAIVAEEFYTEKLEETEKEIDHTNDKVRIDELKRKRSDQKTRIQRIKNSVKDFRFRSVKIPFVGVTVPANDFNVIAGIFMLIISVWIFISMRMIDKLFDLDRYFQESACDSKIIYKSALLLLPDLGQRRGVISFVASFFPVIVVAILIIVDINSFVAYVPSFPFMEWQDRIIPLLDVITARLWALLIILLMLAGTYTMIYISWRHAVGKVTVFLAR